MIDLWAKEEGEAEFPYSVGKLIISQKALRIKDLTSATLDFCSAARARSGNISEAQ